MSQGSFTAVYKFRIDIFKTSYKVSIVTTLAIQVRVVVDMEPIPRRLRVKWENLLPVSPVQHRAP